MADGRRLRPIRIGISACLLGEQVRFDGGHKRDAFLTETFGRFVEWVPVCPEVECGFGTPRESMRLVRIEQGLRLLTIKTGIDLTERMERFSRSRVSALVRDDLSGYVLKKDSPSCGLERVKIYDGHGSPVRGGRGLFAAALVEALPHLPVEEEGRLADPRLREAALLAAAGLGVVEVLPYLGNTLAFTNVWIALAFGVVGWFMIKLDFPRAPLVLALVLAPLLESSLRQSLLLSFGSLKIFVERPLAAALLACVVISIAFPLVSTLRRAARLKNVG